VKHWRLAACVLACLPATLFAHGQPGQAAQAQHVLPRQHAAQPAPQALIARPMQGFVANAPGSYALPAIQAAGDGWVLEGNWLPRRLASYTHGAVTLLSFVYTYCADPIGCPLAYATFEELRRRVVADPALRGRVRFVSLSFDPDNDTPDAMQRYGGEYARSTQLPWHFLTTYSTRFLRPILDGYGQEVDIELDAGGAPTRVLTHMLKVFLIDEDGMVREIYSSAFLQPEVMFNDIKTLVIEATSVQQARR
jgi:cytochrome oxidase Cu insertion factor (SCO1/SenC/PrrC family)